MKMTVTIPDELYWKLQEEIAKRRKPQKDAVVEAIEKYIREGGGTAQPAPKANRVSR